ncbi:unnamed protein product [Cylindrotheca closterium]|uniref:Uncharacterized protein n=1 Tax=Cylindrotheca closterium TaxID=2856 RepID=A0AAD2FXI0_9STRA|nr:unnamed protein product [Cylindrotheca closterium]
MFSRCLKTSNTLRRQLFSTFGSAALFSLALVVIAAGLSIYSAGEIVKEHSSNLMTNHVVDALKTSSRLMAEKLTARLSEVDSSVQLMVESVQDRIVGYPTLEGWDECKYVPFVDSETGNRKYPLAMPPVPMDWNISYTNMLTSSDGESGEAYEAHDSQYNRTRNQLGNRLPYYRVTSERIELSVDVASYHFLGSCDRNADPTSLDWVQGCVEWQTENDNNQTIGGTHYPPPTHSGLYQSTGDLSVFMKPLFESRLDALRINVYLVNSGAGATLSYPASRVTPMSNFKQKQIGEDGLFYISNGCEWMRDINSRTGKPYGSTEFCHPKGAKVPYTEYNPMEEEWAPYFLEQTDKVGYFSPPCSDDDDNHDSKIHQHQLLKAGKAIMDRLTGELIGFTTIDIAVQSLEDGLEDAAAWSNATEVFIIRKSDGQVLGARLPDDKEHGHNNSQDTNRRLLEMAKSGDVFEYDDHLVSANPLVPSKDSESGEDNHHDDHPDTFVPQYYVLLSIPTSNVPLKEEINAAIDNDVIRNVMTSLILFLVGCLAFFIILGGVSSALTDPLLWIEDVAHRVLRDQNSHRRIVLNGDPVKGNLSKVGAVSYAPKTEVYYLVKEFQSVLSGLSGEGVSRVASPTPNSTKNGLTYSNEFESYYGFSDESEKQLHSFDPAGMREDGMRKENSKSRFTLPSMDGNRIENTSVVETPSRRISKYPNPGPVMNESLLATKPVREIKGSERICKSSLFRWIVILIIIPLVLTNAVLVTLVTNSITSSTPQWIQLAEEGSERIARQNLLFVARTKASVMSSVVRRVTRDLHFFSRVVGWLFFEGITRSDSFTKGRSGSAETCKNHSAEDPICPVFPEIPCSCDWESPWETKPWPGCSIFENVTDSRFLQEFHLTGQLTDADNTTGNRNSTLSFPELGSIPDTTYWYSNPAEAPGASKGTNASGDETTYDRMRVSSAASVVYFPIYNYATSLGKKKPILGTFIGFEKDGMFHGADGCYGFDGEIPHAVSSKANRAAEIAPNLCPEGKYGYDPRCRDWYATGKRLYMEGQVPVHVTSPYTFQTTTLTIASGATSPIANPKSGEYIGQVLLDFFPLGLRGSMESAIQQLSFVITPGKDITGGDTVIGPNKTEGWKSEAISDALFPLLGNDGADELRMNFKEKILKPMKNGESDVVEVMLVDENFSPESYILAFAPVTYSLLQPIDPSDFAEGVEESSDVVYSVGIGESKSKIKGPFYEVYEQMRKELENGPRNFFMTVIGVVTTLFVIFTIYVALKVTSPIITLLEIVRDINRGIFSEDIPPLEGGCKESMQVYSIFSRLNKLVMVSNTAFFAHKMDKAKHFLNTALKLFHKIDDEKAIGIASNNLANTLFATLYAESLETEQPLVCSSPGLLNQAIQHYEKAVDVAQNEFESAHVKDKPIFAERLGDRLFNRGMFLLFCSRYSCAPPNAKSEGYENIRRVRTLHYELRDYLLENRLLFEQSASYWNRLIRRINCLLAFYNDEELRNLWDAENLLDEADEVMMALWQMPAAPLFTEVTPNGRRQQLEGAAIILCHQIGHDDQAYHLAMRMFAQDEYLLDASFVPAAETLLDIAEAGEIAISAKLQNELRTMLRNRSRNPMEFLTMETF